MLPPMSAPKPNKEHFRAIIPPSPPELPPVDLNLFQGFRDLPQRLFPVSEVIPNWATLVCTNGIIPAFLKQEIITDYFSFLLAFEINPIVALRPWK